jgi:prepilin-type N-terminal cleavage/methylation domain-containing protein
MRPRATSRSRGFTLLEVVVALSVFIVLLLGLATSLASGLAVDTLTRERVAATLRATSVMEEMTAVAWDQLPTRDGLTFDVAIASEGGQYALPPGGGRFEPGLVRVTDLGQRDLRSIEVSVVFRSKGTGTDANVALRYLVAKH